MLSLPCQRSIAVSFAAINLIITLSCKTVELPHSKTQHDTDQPIAAKTYNPLCWVQDVQAADQKFVADNKDNFTLAQDENIITKKLQLMVDLIVTLVAKNILIQQGKYRTQKSAWLLPIKPTRISNLWMRSFTPL